MHFVVNCIGSDPLGLRETLEQVANEQWLPTRRRIVMRDELDRCVWLKPSLVVQCKFASWEKGGLRHAHFVGLRYDKHRKAVTSGSTNAN